MDQHLICAKMNKKTQKQLKLEFYDQDFERKKYNNF